MDKDLMWFFDDPPEDYKKFRKEAQLIEQEYLEQRVLLRDAESDMRAEPQNENLQAKVKYLQKRIKSLEEKAPWLISGQLKECDLWGVPH